MQTVEFSSRLHRQVPKPDLQHSHNNTLSHMLPDGGLFRPFPKSTATTFECHKTQHDVLWGAITGRVIAMLQAHARKQLLQLSVGCLRGRVIPTT